MCLWLRYRQFLNICACDWSVDTNHELSLVEIDIWIMSLLVWRSKSWVSSLSLYFFIWTQKWFLFGPRLSNKKDILLSSILRPCKEDGVILRRQNRLLVQLSTPPAARYTRLRFFRGNCFSTQEIKLGTRSTFLTKFLLHLIEVFLKSLLLKDCVNSWWKAFENGRWSKKRRQGPCLVLQSYSEARNIYDENFRGGCSYLINLHVFQQISSYRLQKIIVKFVSNIRNRKTSVLPFSKKWLQNYLHF